MVVAEIPVFVFPSLLLQCNHPRECIYRSKKEHLLSSLYVPGLQGTHKDQ